MGGKTCNSTSNNNHETKNSLQSRQTHLFRWNWLSISATKLRLTQLSTFRLQESTSNTARSSIATEKQSFGFSAWIACDSFLERYLLSTKHMCSGLSQFENKETITRQLMTLKNSDKLNKLKMSVFNGGTRMRYCFPFHWTNERVPGGKSRQCRG